MKKFRKYDEGGSVDETDMDTPVGPGPKDISFKESFRRAKDAGLKTFSFGGKKFTTDMASAKAAAPAAKTAAPSKSSAPAASEKDNEVPSSGRYKQDTYETPLKSAARRVAPEVMDNLGKIAAGLGAGAGAAYGGSKLINAANAVDKARKEAALVAGNAGLRNRMGDIVARATQKVAEGPALREANEDLATRMAVAKSAARGAADRAGRSQQGVTAAKDDMGFYKKGGTAKCYAKGGSVGSASRRADGIASKGKTKGRIY